MKDLTDKEKRLQKAAINILEGLWEQEYRYQHGGRSYEEEQERIAKEKENNIIASRLHEKQMKWGQRRYKISDYLDKE